MTEYSIKRTQAVGCCHPLETQIQPFAPEKWKSSSKLSSMADEDVPAAPAAVEPERSEEKPAAPAAAVKTPEPAKEKKEELENITKILYAEARLIEGLEIDNPTKITNLICDILAK